MSLVELCPSLARFGHGFLHHLHLSVRGGGSAPSFLPALPALHALHALQVVGFSYLWLDIILIRFFPIPSLSAAA